MRAYLITTALLFGALALVHIWRVIVEWPRSTVDPGFALEMVVVIVLPGILSWWAWCLLRRLSGDQARPGSEKTQKGSDDAAA